MNNIYIVDEDITIKSGLHSKLSLEGFAVSFYDGQDFQLENIVNHFKITQPEVLIAEFDFNELNGIELINKIRSNYEFSSMPIFFYSKNKSEEARARGLDGGADYYFHKKDLNIDDFVEKIKIILDNKSKLHEIEKV